MLCFKYNFTGWITPNGNATVLRTSGNFSPINLKFEEEKLNWLMKITNKFEHIFDYFESPSKQDGICSL
jgi:hypothetical protein